MSGYDYVDHQAGRNLTVSLGYCDGRGVRSRTRGDETVDCEGEGIERLTAGREARLAKGQADLDRIAHAGLEGNRTRDSGGALERVGGTTYACYGERVYHPDRFRRCE